MKALQDSLQDFLSFMAQELPDQKLVNLYAPVHYIMNLGGKRIRPVLALWACEANGEQVEKALPAALSVEAFHNFSLIHDDIMDEAPLRRGQATVHQKWDTNTGILSGDVLLVCAYQYLESYEGSSFKQLTKTFSETARWVCEGQQMDMDFPNQKKVRLTEYIEMITKKTAVLIAASLKMGAIAAGAAAEKCDLFYDFGQNIGIAFQLQDDYLDAFGDPETFGKQIGGDIIENKKTYLYLYAIAHLAPADAAILQELYSTHPQNTKAKIEQVKAFFELSGATQAIQAAKQQYLDQAFTALDQLKLESKHHQRFSDLAHFLIQREV